MKYEDAKALVIAMFGSTSPSKGGTEKMISPEVQYAYSKMFGGYPIKPFYRSVDKENSFWAGRLRAIAETLDGVSGVDLDAAPQIESILKRIERLEAALTYYQNGVNDVIEVVGKEVFDGGLRRRLIAAIREATEEKP